MDQRTVDLIIVGAGSAGAALANRLIRRRGRHPGKLKESQRYIAADAACR